MRSGGSGIACLVSSVNWKQVAVTGEHPPPAVNDATVSGVPEPAVRVTTSVSPEASAASRLTLIVGVESLPATSSDGATLLDAVMRGVWLGRPVSIGSLTDELGWPNVAASLERSRRAR